MVPFPYYLKLCQKSLFIDLKTKKYKNYTMIWNDAVGTLLRRLNMQTRVLIVSIRVGLPFELFKVSLWILIHTLKYRLQ